jgi:hypothetical protein
MSNRIGDGVNYNVVYTAMLVISWSDLTVNSLFQTMWPKIIVYCAGWIVFYIVPKVDEHAGVINEMFNHCTVKSS